MYSWNTIRTVAAVLLLVPILHLAYLMSSEAEATLDPSPLVWADEVAAYEKADRNRPLPAAPLVVVGGRSVTLWPDLAELLAPVPVLMRGLGNATIDDITYYYDRLIGHYGPSAVAILPDKSELHIRDSKSAEEIVAAIQELTALNLSHEVTRFVYVFPPLKTPRYPQDRITIDRATKLLQAWASEQDRVSILDANDLMDDRSGETRPYFFHNDGASLNDYGYLRLTTLLRDAVERDYPQLFQQQ